ncbi:hypothetical protein GCM10007285_17420 [Stappia taiwanensis]|uniref:asparagine synthetase B family protein n=1 Tax=Stappia taiwanensis TaxID=992267 RepID=UPI0019C72947|nr:asparagine synthase-related protein [Stappia taiwanensis]GGE90473.1 hypothetical protein GCM10007285_17420 [Stappia taiwanensis]
MRIGADRHARDDDGEAAIVGVQTGALYNHEELRRDLEQRGIRFAGRSETEVLLRAYRQWGADFVGRLEGMFAFAIWDAGRRQLLLGRDRFGMKPLYYHAFRDGLLFASEPKGIMAHPRFVRRLDLDRLPMVLQPRLALPGETPLAGLHELPAAHLLTVTEAGTATRRYWRLVSAPHGDDFAATAGRVRGLLEDSVARQAGASAGAALGAMLSGGIDSTSVAALASAARRRQRPDAALPTFCLRFGGDAAHFQPTELRPDVDAPFAAEAAAFLGCRHESVTAAASDLPAVIPATRRARDLPGWGQFDASMYLLFREVHRDCKVALTGEAADEFFGGYPHVQDPEYDRALLREAHRLANDPGSAIAGLFDTGRLNGLIAAVGDDPSGAMRARAFPGGSSAPHLLIQLLELGRWVEDYRVPLG